MGDLRKVFWVCLACQTVPILFLITIAILSRQNIVTLPGSLWFMPVIYIANCIGCIAILTIKCNKIFKQLAQNEHETFFDHFIRYNIYHFSNKFAESLDIYNSNNENTAIKKLFKSYNVSGGLIILVILVEIAITTTILF